MANYTAEIRFLISYGNVIFDFDYPKLDGIDYPALEQQFIDRNYFREIGFDTVDKFKHHLKSTWLASINGYNRRKKQFLDHIDTIEPLSNFKSTGSNTSKQVFNDTPMSKLGDVDYATSVTDGTGEMDNGGYSGLTEMELLEKYYDHYRDLDDEFLNKFDCLFMQIF